MKKEEAELLAKQMAQSAPSTTITPINSPDVEPNIVMANVNGSLSTGSDVTPIAA